MTEERPLEAQSIAEEALARRAAEGKCDLATGAIKDDETDVAVDEAPQLTLAIKLAALEQAITYSQKWDEYRKALALAYPEVIVSEEAVTDEIVMRPGSVCDDESQDDDCCDEEEVDPYSAEQRWPVASNYIEKLGLMGWNSLGHAQYSTSPETIQRIVENELSYFLDAKKEMMRHDTKRIRAALENDACPDSALRLAALSLLDEFENSLVVPAGFPEVFHLSRHEFSRGCRDARVATALGKVLETVTNDVQYNLALREALKRAQDMGESGEESDAPPPPKPVRRIQSKTRES